MDDLKIADVTCAAGAEVSFFCDRALADDMTGTTEVIRDAINHLDLITETHLRDGLLRSRVGLVEGG